MTFSNSLQVLLTGLFLLGAAGARAEGEWPQEKRALVEAAVANMMSLDRPGQVGLATVFDGNKFVQCRRADDRSIRCEAAGTLMQPSLNYTLTGAKIEALEAFGWTNDPSFGNWIQTFPADATPQRIANEIETALADVYDADPKTTEAHTDWLVKQECLPRVFERLDRAGSVNVDGRSEAHTIRACAYKPQSDAGPAVKNGDPDDLVAAYGARMAGELQRLRVNLDRDVFAIFDVGIGYVQCEPQTAPDVFYCEAQSADVQEAIQSILTPERIARLHAAGFADPGRAPNYWRTYPLGEITDSGLASELLTILHDVYGYRGKPKLRIVTEQGG
jgi:hypothetical protein